MKALVACIVVATALAGCSASFELGGCTEDDRRTVWEDATRFLADLHLQSFDLIWDGTKSGVPAEERLVIQPDAGIAAVQRTDLAIVVDAPFYTYTDGTESSYRRDYDPGLVAYMGSQYARQDVDPALRIPHPFADMDSSCGELVDYDVYMFRIDDGAVHQELLVDREHPERPFRVKLVDPAAQHEYVIIFDYEPTTVTLDASLPRGAVSLTIDEVEQAGNSLGGLYWKGAITTDSNWAPFDEIMAVLVDAQGQALLEAELSTGRIDFGGGQWFEFHDLDGDGFLSAGDEYEINVGPGRDIVFYDLWADGFAGETYT